MPGALRIPQHSKSGTQGKEGVRCNPSPTDSTLTRDESVPDPSNVFQVYRNDEGPLHLSRCPHTEIVILSGHGKWRQKGGRENTRAVDIPRVLLEVQDALAWRMRSVRETAMGTPKL